MNDASAQRQIDELKARINRTDDVLATLIAWLQLELGSDSATELINTLNGNRTNNLQ